MPTLEELLLKLEERFILGEVSEKVYLELPDGHLKIPHLWPGQNPPPSDSRTVVS